jgi:hypothetical protein
MIAFVGGDTVVSRFETIQGEIQENSENKIRRSEIWEINS